MPNENFKDVLLHSSKIFSFLLFLKENLFSAASLKVAGRKCEECELSPNNFIPLSFYADDVLEMVSCKNIYKTYLVYVLLHPFFVNKI